ncbi:SAC3/GANP/THP3 [Trypanosoma melophagium]|uniref:SAC3/GANP/THP3 n=1 Tax=Trypanosoma melophagium TaxID=715481 RepID=UPI003519FC43|nr:SAC3/GANP/THP3 [Trypanosoma melophagium]
MQEDALGVRAALAAPPFAGFCAVKSDEPPRRGSLAALCGGDPAQRPAAAPAFEQQYRSRTPLLPTTVEAYGRSAAGVVVEQSHLRTPMALEKSMHFLVHHYLRDPHTPAVFLAPFDVWRHLWDRMRQVRTNWVPQLPPVGTEYSYDYNGKSSPGGEHSGNSVEDVVLRNVKESKRRLRWLEFTVAALALGGANLCRTTQGCRRYMEEKQNFLESIAQCFGDLVLSYRAEQRLRNSEMFSALIIFYGLSQLTKIENRAGFCRVFEVTLAGDAAPTHIFELPSSSVDFASVYRELACLPQLVHTRHVRTALRLIHCWCQRAWFRFFYLCRTLGLTVLQRAMVFHSFAYARFRAVVDLVTANAVVYSKVRVRGEMEVKQLAALLLMEPAHCVELLETMGLAGQMSADRSVLYLARHDSSPYTTQDAIYKHLEDTGGKQRLCLPTFPSFFGFKVWRKAFDLFPDALPGNADTADLRNMTCPVNLMELLEPYCPPYNEDVAALELRDAENEWFSDVQTARERMLWRCIKHNSHHHHYMKTNEDVHRSENNSEDDYNNDNDNDNNSDNDGGMSYRSDGSDMEELDDEQEKERRRAMIAALDRESKSTSSSIFSDYYDVKDGDSEDASGMVKPLRGEGKEAEMETTDQVESPESEENDVLRNATNLIQSLQNDKMYAKIREELRQEKKRDKFVSKETDEENRTRTSSPPPSSIRTEQEEEEGEEREETNNNNNTEEKEKEQKSQQQQKKKSSFAWLTLPQPKEEVMVTPLPSDHPGRMSPSLKAIKN